MTGDSLRALSVRATSSFVLGVDRKIGLNTTPRCSCTFRTWRRHGAASVPRRESVPRKDLKCTPYSRRVGNRHGTAFSY